MIEPLQYNEFVKMRDLIVNACGIYLEDDKDYLVESRLTDLGNEVGAETFSHLHQLIIMDQPKMMPQVIDLMTTNETYWFRDKSLWKALEEKIIPDFFELLKKGEKKQIKIWSAACSTGQEPYSLSLLIEEIAEKPGNQVFKNCFQILGTDISDAALVLAKSGKANFLSVKRGLSEERLNKYFKQDGRSYILDKEIINRVEFKKFNLMDSFIFLGKFDLVLCRNVAIYFTEEFKKELFRKIAGSLNPQGKLVIGASESLFGYSGEYQSLSYENAIYYQLKERK